MGEISTMGDEAQLDALYGDSNDFEEIEKPVEQSEKKNVNPEFCSSCAGTGFYLHEGSSSIEAKTCSCISEIEFDGHNWDREKKLKEHCAFFNVARIPNRYLKVRKSDDIPNDAIKWLDSYLSGCETQNFLFLYGDVGTGKTHTAAYILLEILKKGLEKTVLYLPIHEFVERREKYLSFRFSKDFEEKSRISKMYLWLQEDLISRDVVVLDELGQEKLSPDERKIIFKLLDDRYNNNKPTILISNHCDNKAFTLEGKLLKSLVGARISSRIKSAKEIHFQGYDRRAQEGGASISKSEIENFMVPAKILTHDSDTHQIMTWLTRNPAFEVVSTQKRKDFSETIDGIERDKDRTQASVYNDVWVDGDSLIISGPICDHEDKKLYAFLVKELVNRHKSGIPGLSVELSFRYILRNLNGNEGGSAMVVLQRQLDRLNRMSITFTNLKGNKWTGPLLTTVAQKGLSRDRVAIIEFNRYMITFYKLHEYTTVQKNLSKEFKGDSSAFYFFYSSHSLKEMRVSVDRCKKLLGISPDFDKKEGLKRVKKAVSNLIEVGVMDPQKTFIKDGKVHTCLAV